MQECKQEVIKGEPYFVIKALVGRLSLCVGWEKGPERTVSFNLTLPVS